MKEMRQDRLQVASASFRPTVVWLGSGATATCEEYYGRPGHHVEYRAWTIIRMGATRAQSTT
jgi:hypothetical protein